MSQMRAAEQISRDRLRKEPKGGRPQTEQGDMSAPPSPYKGAAASRILDGASPSMRIIEERLRRIQDQQASSARRPESRLSSAQEELAQEMPALPRPPLPDSFLKRHGHAPEPELAEQEEGGEVDYLSEGMEPVSVPMAPRNWGADRVDERYYEERVAPPAARIRRAAASAAVPAWKDETNRVYVRALIEAAEGESPFFVATAVGAHPRVGEHLMLTDAKLNIFWTEVLRTYSPRPQSNASLVVYLKTFGESTSHFGSLWRGLDGPSLRQRMLRPPSQRPPSPLSQSSTAGANQGAESPAGRSRMASPAPPDSAAGEAGEPGSSMRREGQEPKK